MPKDLRSDETKFWHAEIKQAVTRERERCATIAEARSKEDREKYAEETDWRQPYASNRVVRASMDIAAAIRRVDQ